MRRVVDAQAILGRTETELRALIQTAVADGRYDEVALLAQMAEGVAALRTLDAAPARVGALDPGADGLSPAQARAERLRPLRLHGRRLPRFVRDGGILVKIAPSRQPGQAEYEHRAPFAVVEALVETIKRKKGLGAKFTAGEILPLVNSKTKREIPSYQSYLALAWLREEGVVVRHGRDRYSLKPTAVAGGQVPKLWKALPARHD